MLALDHHARSHRLLASGDQPLFVLLASRQELPVQVREIRRFRHRHPVIAPEVSSFSFDAALLVRLGRRAKLRLESPVRTEGNEASRLFPPMSAQNLLHRRGQVVIAKLAEHAAKVGERQLVRFQKRLLGGMQIGAVKRRSARHAAHRKHLQLDSLAAQIGIGFVPIDLRFHAPGITLRNAGLAHHQPSAIFRSCTYSRTVRSAILHIGQLAAESAPRCDAPCAAVCAALFGRLPESRR